MKGKSPFIPILIMLFFLLAIPLNSLTSNSRSVSPSNYGKIAFASCRDGNWDIYVMNADGNNQQRLTINYAGDYDPAWSPDGTKIAFISDRDGNNEIYIMDADGSNQRNLTNNLADEYEPAWSPDCEKIAFISDREGNLSIFIMNKDGSNQKRLTKNGVISEDQNYIWLEAPAWSPDGTKIAFTSKKNGSYQIYVMDADGSNQRKLTRDPDWNFHPTWSSDGKKIAFVSRRDGNWEIYVMDADGSNQRRLTKSRGGDFDPAWSPDRKKIAFVSYRDGILVDKILMSEIYVMNADGNNQQRITFNSANDFAPAWCCQSIINSSFLNPD